jgi:hypothetical protein
LLCEEPLTASVLYRDDETGQEEWVHEEIPHFCLPMRELRKERTRSDYAKTRANRPARLPF